MEMPEYNVNNTDAKQRLNQHGTGPGGSATTLYLSGWTLAEGTGFYYSQLGSCLPTTI